MNDMLSEKDIRRIGEEMGRVLEQNITPQFDAIHEEIGGIKGEIGGLKGEIVGIKTRLTKIEATMVTKDYLDDKLADLRGEFRLKHLR